jgi:periplasmic copper chaperone A
MTTHQAGCARSLSALAFSALLSSAAIPSAQAHVSLANREAAPNSSYKAVLQVPHGCDGEATTAVRVQIPEGVIAQQCAKGEAAWIEIPAAGQSTRELKKPAPALRIAANTKLAQAGGHDHQHGASTTAAADSFKVGDITVASPWTRATPGGAKVAGGYLKVTNSSTAADKLVGGTTDIAGRVEVHEMSMSGGVMQMRPLNAGLELKAGQSVELKPGGYHLMFLDLKRQLKEGDTIKATLQFEKAGTVDVTFRVGTVGGAAAPQKHKH